MTRRNTENLVEDILGDFEYEIQPPYLLYRNAAQEVNGIWFYNQQDCDAVANLFSRILNAFSKIPPKPKFSSAKSEFEEIAAVPNLAVMECPLEPPTSSTASVPDVHVPDNSFVNYFSAAMNIGNAPGPNASAAGPPPYQSSTIPSSSLAARIIPPALTPFQPAPFLPTLSAPLIPSSISSNHTTISLSLLFLHPHLRLLHCHQLHLLCRPLCLYSLL